MSVLKLEKKLGVLLRISCPAIKTSNSEERPKILSAINQSTVPVQHIFFSREDDDAVPFETGASSTPETPTSQQPI